MLPIRDALPTRSKPLVTRSLVLLNVAVYVATLYDLPKYIASYGFIPSLVLENPYRLITHMFLHGGFIHVAGNMLFLWVFGAGVEDRMGHVRFLLFYISCGLAAALFHALTTEAPHLAAVGASGAVSGVMGAYLFYFPRSRIITVLLIPIVALLSVPAYLYIGAWLIYQLLYGLLQSMLGEIGGTAYLAHLGGFLFGLLVAPIARRKAQAHAALG